MTIDAETLPSEICKLTPTQPTYELALTDPDWGGFLVGAKKTIYAVGAKPDLAGKPDEIVMFSTEINVGESGIYNFFVTGDDYYVFFIDCVRIVSSNPSGPGKTVDVNLTKGLHKFFVLVQNNTDTNPIWFGLTIHADGEFLYEARSSGWLAQTYTPNLIDEYKEAQTTTTAKKPPVQNSNGSSCSDLLFGGDFKITPSTTAKPTPPPCANPNRIEDAIGIYQPKLRVQYEKGWSAESSLVVSTKTAKAKLINDIYLDVVKRPAEKEGLNSWNSDAISQKWTDEKLREMILESAYTELKSGKVLGIYNYCDWVGKTTPALPPPEPKPPEPEPEPENACLCLHGATNSMESEFNAIVEWGSKIKEKDVLGYVMFVIVPINNAYVFPCAFPYTTIGQRDTVVNYTKALFQIIWPTTGWKSARMYFISISELKALYAVRVKAVGATPIDKYCHFSATPESVNPMLSTLDGGGTLIFPRKKVCNQNPTGQVYETLLPKGSLFPGNKKKLEWDYYAIHVQQIIDKAAGNRMYLMKALIDIPSAGTYLFDFFSDDEHEIYIDCNLFSQGSFGYYSKNATLPAGTVEFIFRYKNVPNLTHGYIAFNIWSGNTLMYQSRAQHFKGQENAIGEINWTDE